MARRSTIPKARVDTVIVLRDNATDQEHAYGQGTRKDCEQWATRYAAKLAKRNVGLQLRPLDAWRAAQAAAEQARWDALPEAEKRARALAWAQDMQRGLLALSKALGLPAPNMAKIGE